ncbi:MAG TPA: hypothetical protein DCY13_09445 [Verrucomicrobiales bacterium]|nr:hypothetical protein [Verrucomicrobiales bacterium]
MRNSLSQLTPADLRRAAALKEKIASLQDELNRLLGGKPGASGRSGGGRGGWKMSPEAKAKIAAAQRKRWSKLKRSEKK